MTTTIEAAVVLGEDGEPIYWHVPPDRDVVTLPDSRALWDVFWQNRATMTGQAHSHPGTGQPYPSYEDITTFAACEEGLGRRYTWWIASMDRLVAIRWLGPERHAYSVRLIPPAEEPAWVAELRRRSVVDTSTASSSSPYT